MEDSMLPLLILLVVLVASNLVISSITLYKSKKDKNENYTSPYKLSPPPGRNNQLSNPPGGNNQLSNPPGGNINCPSPDCKQGDGYCFCMYGCYDQKGNRNILLKDDCSRGIPFDPDQTCKVFGPDTVAGSPFEGGGYQGYTNQDIVASCLKNQ
jgi:hypothetical protein